MRPRGALPPSGSGPAPGRAASPWGRSAAARLHADRADAGGGADRDRHRRRQPGVARPGGDQLEQEAARLAALLESARAEARASGVAARWEPLRRAGRRQRLSLRRPAAARRRCRRTGSTPARRAAGDRRARGRARARAADRRAAHRPSPRRPAPDARHRRHSGRSSWPPTTAGSAAVTTPRARLHADRGAGRAGDRRDHARRRHQGGRLADRNTAAPGRRHRRPVVRRQPAHRLKLAQPVPGHRRQPTSPASSSAAATHGKLVVRPTPNPNFRRVDARIARRRRRGTILLLSTILGRYAMTGACAPLPRLHAGRGAGRDGRSWRSCR